MLPQQFIALIVIIFFIFKLAKQKKKNIISKNELIFWLVFWMLAALGIIFVKQLDLILNNLGITSSGINFLFYISVLILFYFIFRLRLNLAKLDNQLTELARQVSIDRVKKNENE